MKLKQWVKLIPLSVVASSLCLCAYASSDLEAIMKARNLSEKDILAAAKTYQPSGRRDEYICLLYTSPSPRDWRSSRMPSSA